MQRPTTKGQLIRPMPTVYNRLHRYGFTNLTKEQKWELGGLVRAAYTNSGINILIYRKKSIENGGEYIVRDYHPRFNDAMDKVIFEYCAAIGLVPQDVPRIPLEFHKTRQRRPKGDVKTSCSKCGNPLELERVGKQRYCKICHAANMREARKEDAIILAEVKRERKKIKNLAYSAKSNKNKSNG